MPLIVELDKPLITDPKELRLTVDPNGEEIKKFGRPKREAAVCSVVLYCIPYRQIPLPMEEWKILLVDGDLPYSDSIEPLKVQQDIREQTGLDIAQDRFVHVHTLRDQTVLSVDLYDSEIENAVTVSKVMCGLPFDSLGKIMLAAYRECLI